MKRLFFLALIVALSFSCKNESSVKEGFEPEPGLILVADNIIYDVNVKAESDDPWDLEKVAGFSGDLMIDDLFEGLYSGKLKARDYHSGKVLSPNDIKKIEQQPGFERNNIGKIQFTEDWYYNPTLQKIDKKVVLMVFGYKTITEDIAGAGYMAAFEIAFE